MRYAVRLQCNGWKSQLPLVLTCFAALPLLDIVQLGRLLARVWAVCKVVLIRRQCLTLCECVSPVHMCSYFCVIILIHYSFRSFGLKFQMNFRNSQSFSSKFLCIRTSSGNEILKNRCIALVLQSNVNTTLWDVSSDHFLSNL